MKRTKIVATISDKRCDVDFLKSLFDAGMNVVRLNTAHQSHENSLKVINNVRKVSERIAILLDTKGPEIRTKASDKEIQVVAGDKLYVTGNPEQETTGDTIAVSYPGIVNDIAIGNRLLIDDGDIELQVIEKNDGFLYCEVHNDGIIAGKKSVNIPSAQLKLDSLSNKDRDYIRFAAANDLDFIAHSFVRRKEDIQAIKAILEEEGKSIKIIAKIENQEGVDNIDEILEEADGVMVARGDLAIEIPQSRITIIQKMIIQKAIEKRKPVITATQMLHSMIRNPRPTRAEVSDIANAIYDGTDALMLSGETAYGKYPLKAVELMTSVALEVERDNLPFLDVTPLILNNEVSFFLAKEAVRASQDLDAKAIVADTQTGRTIRGMAAYRGKKFVHAQCYNKRVMRELALSYGVVAHYQKPLKTHEKFIRYAIERLLEVGAVHEDERIIALGGNFGASYGASFIEVGLAKDMKERLFSQ